METQVHGLVHVLVTMDQIITAVLAQQLVLATTDLVVVQVQQGLVHDLAIMDRTAVLHVLVITDQAQEVLLVLVMEIREQLLALAPDLVTVVRQVVAAHHDLTAVDHLVLVAVHHVLVIADLHLAVRDLVIVGHRAVHLLDLAIAVHHQALVLHDLATVDLHLVVHHAHQALVPALHAPVMEALQAAVRLQEDHIAQEVPVLADLHLGEEAVAEVVADKIMA